MALGARLPGSNQNDENLPTSRFLTCLLPGSVGVGSMNGHHGSSLHCSAPSLTGIQTSPPDVILAMDQPTVHYLMDHLKSLPSTFIQTGGTLFIHPQLYQDGLPPLLQNISALSNMHTYLNSSDHIISLAISSTAQNIVNSFSTLHTFNAKLAFTQSLILLQIMTLLSLSPPISHVLRQQAENRLPLLQASIEELYLSAPVTLPSSMGHYQAWILAESCRRTIHVGHMVLGVHSMLTKGNFTLTLFVEALPLNRNAELWERDLSVYDEQTKGEPGHGDMGGTGKLRASETDLISYRELTDMWDNGEVKDPSFFEELLLVACKGVDNVKTQTNVERAENCTHTL